MQQLSNRFAKQHGGKGQHKLLTEQVRPPPTCKKASGIPPASCRLLSCQGSARMPLLIPLANPSFFLASANLTTKGTSAPGKTVLALCISIAASASAHLRNCTKAHPASHTSNVACFLQFRLFSRAEASQLLYASKDLHRQGRLSFA